MHGFLLKIIRPVIQIITLATIVLIYLYTQRTYKNPQVIFVHLTQFYGIAAVIYLYITLIISPFYAIFSDYPFSNLLRVAKRPVGQGAFIFALLHAAIGLFKQLNGFRGILFLSGSDLVAVIAGVGALLILALLGVTSFDWAIRLLGGKEWKFLHRLVYVAAFFIVVHVFLFGTHFNDGSLWTTKVSFVLVGYLLLLEVLRTIKWIKMKQKKKIENTLQ